MGLQEAYGSLARPMLTHAQPESATTFKLQLCAIFALPPHVLHFRVVEGGEG